MDSFKKINALAVVASTELNNVEESSQISKANENTRSTVLTLNVEAVAIAINKPLLKEYVQQVGRQRGYDSHFGQKCYVSTEEAMKICKQLMKKGNGSLPLAKVQKYYIQSYNNGLEGIQKRRKTRR